MATEAGTTDPKHKKANPLEKLAHIDNPLQRQKMSRYTPGVISSFIESTMTGGLEFEDLTYTVTKKQMQGDGKLENEEVDLLHKIAGHAPRGSITAVIGPSGAGKSTFLDGLAGRIASGSLRGRVSLDGEEMSPSLIKRTSAYVMQDDRLFPMLTVWETLMFAADFRLGSTVTRREKELRAETLIEQLGLTAARNTYIGNEETRGVSGGERRRVSIGVDIIHDPALLFLDEPTSGLDSTSAYSVIEKVSGIARAGSTVILTIHQPSHRIQRLLDHLIVLARGQLVYQGPPKDVAFHLGGMGREVPKGENSIEYLLDVIQLYDRSPPGVAALAEYCRTGVKPPAVADEPEISFISSSPAIIIKPLHNGLVSPNNTSRMGNKFKLQSPRQVKQARDEDDISNEIPVVPLRDPMAIRSATDFNHSVRSPWAKSRGGSGGSSFVDALRITSSGNTPRRNRDRPTPSYSPGYYMDSTEIVPCTPTPHSSDYTVGESDYQTPTGRRGFRKSLHVSLGPKFPNSFGSEVVILIRRNFLNIRRTPELFASRLVVLTVMGFMMATMFKDPKSNMQGITNLLSFFIFTVCLFFFSSNDAVPAFIQERFIFIRESSHNAYRASSYAISGLITYLPFLAVQAVTYALIVWFALKLDGSFVYFVLILYVSLISTNSFVMFVSSIVPNYILGYAAVIALTALFFLFCGYFLSKADIPNYWMWLHYISTIKYPYEGQLINQFADTGACYSWNEHLPHKCDLGGKELLKGLSIGSRSISKWGSLVILLGWAVFYRILFYIVLRFASKNQRT